MLKLQTVKSPTNNCQVHVPSTTSHQITNRCSKMNKTSRLLLVWFPSPSVHFSIDLVDRKQEKKMENPTVISQTQDDKEQCKQDTPHHTSDSILGASISKAYVGADRKPMVQLALDRQRMMKSHDPQKRKKDI
jgi:hypothetical protein